MIDLHLERLLCSSHVETDRGRRMSKCFQCSVSEPVIPANKCIPLVPGKPPGPRVHLICVYLVLILLLVLHWAPRIMQGSKPSQSNPQGMVRSGEVNFTHSPLTHLYHIKYHNLKPLQNLSTLLLDLLSGPYHLHQDCAGPLN